MNIDRYSNRPINIDRAPDVTTEILLYLLSTEGGIQQINQINNITSVNVI